MFPARRIQLESRGNFSTIFPNVVREVVSTFPFKSRLNEGNGHNDAKRLFLRNRSGTIQGYDVAEVIIRTDGNPRCLLYCSFVRGTCSCREHGEATHVRMYRGELLVVQSVGHFTTGYNCVRESQIQVSIVFCKQSTEQPASRFEYSHDKSRTDRS